MGIIASIFGRAFRVEAPHGRLDREDGFVDVTLPIVEHRWLKDGGLHVVARAAIKRRVVGLAVDLAPEWSLQVHPDVPIPIFRGKGFLRSVGPESDAFVALLADAYRLPRRTRMAPRVEVAMASLGSDPRDLRERPAKIKIFFEAGGRARYGEAFINIDLVGEVLEFCDKDPEYHPGIIASLSETV